jgi:hypothetical protein
VGQLLAEMAIVSETFLGGEDQAGELAAAGLNIYNLGVGMVQSPFAFNIARILLKFRLVMHRPTF